MRSWISWQIADQRIHPLLLGNFDQVWSLSFRPRKTTLQPRGAAVDPCAKSSSMKKIRRLIQRTLGQDITHAEPTDDSLGAGTAKVQGGYAGHTVVESYRIPHTLTTLTWANGDLGRGLATVCADNLSDKQRRELNQDMCVFCCCLPCMCVCFFNSTCSRLGYVSRYVKIHVYIHTYV